MTTGTGEGRVTRTGASEDRSIPIDSFAARLMLVRVHAGYITIKEAAEKCGLNYGSWSNWERGSRPQDLIEIADAISDGLGIDRDWLLFGGPLAPPEPAGRRQLKRRGLRDTAEYDSETIRTSPGNLDVTSVGPFGRTPTRPTAADHRPNRRRERAGTAPSLPRPAVLPRRTSV